MGSNSQRSRLFAWPFVACVVLACSSSSSGSETSYGTVVVELRAAEADASATFAGTTTIVATLEYGACLERFYREHDDDAFTGDDGESVVASWSESLCDEEDDDSRIACEVVVLEQHLDAGAPRLVVTYSVTGAIEGRTLAIGPLPDEGSADCPGGALPGVRLGPDALIGRGADGLPLWTAQPVESVAVVDGTPVVVYAAMVDSP